jgi:hypothetical protein
MRIAGVVFVLAFIFAGCKSKDGGPDPDEAKRQQELVARRDALMAARQKLKSEREQVDVEIQEQQAKGADTTELVKRRSELDTQLESETANLLTTLETGMQSIQRTTDKSAQIAGREAEIASRERSVAQREKDVAAREAALLHKQGEAIDKLPEMIKEACSGQSSTVIVQAPKGGNYGKKEITDVLTKAKSLMGRRGILTSDLPGPAQSLEGDASKAMTENDLSKAYVYAAQLLQNVEAIQINRQFIQAKTARLSQQVKSSKVDEATTQQLSSILSDVMQKYNDGDFTSANKRLNDLARKL